jgi:hypothetical protein
MWGWFGAQTYPHFAHSSPPAPVTTKKPSKPLFLNKKILHSSYPQHQQQLLNFFNLKTEQQ